MSEYIVDVGDADEKHVQRFKTQATSLFGHPVNEQVVRCRDCVSCHRDEDGMWCCLYGTGFYRSPRYEGDYCSRGKRRDA